MGQDEEFCIIHITIYEGRNREIRKMFENLKIKIYNLKRISIGQLKLANLQMGKYKYLSEKDLELIYMGD